MRKTITLGGLSISYLEKNEIGNQIIFFIHGNSSSSKLWKKQFNSELFDNYRLIAIDLPGHGHSSGSQNPSEDYSPIGTARIISQAIKEIALGQPFILVGFSYGTNVIAEMLAWGIKPLGIVMMGMCAIGAEYSMDKVFFLGEKPSIFFRDEPDREFVSQFLKQSLFTSDEEAFTDLVNDYYAVKHPFRAALMQSAAEGRVQDEMNILISQDIPVCVIFGQSDNLVRINYLDESKLPVWKKIYKFPYSGHWVNLDNPQKFNQLVSEYAAEMFTKSRVLVRS